MLLIRSFSCRELLERITTCSPTPPLKICSPLPASITLHQALLSDYPVSRKSSSFRCFLFVKAGHHCNFLTPGHMNIDFGRQRKLQVFFDGSLRTVTVTPVARLCTQLLFSQTGYCANLPHGQQLRLGRFWPGYGTALGLIRSAASCTRGSMVVTVCLPCGRPLLRSTVVTVMPGAATMHSSLFMVCVYSGAFASGRPLCLFHTLADPGKMVLNCICTIGGLGGFR